MEWKQMQAYVYDLLLLTPWPISSFKGFTHPIVSHSVIQPEVEI